MIVAALLHQHFGVGFHIAHSTLHSLEAAGVGIAVVSTLAATVGEVLAARHAAAAAAAVAAAGAEAGGAAAAGAEAGTARKAADG